MKFRCSKEKTEKGQGIGFTSEGTDTAEEEKKRGEVNTKAQQGHNGRTRIEKRCSVSCSGRERRVANSLIFLPLTLTPTPIPTQNGWWVMGSAEKTGMAKSLIIPYSHPHFHLHCYCQFPDMSEQVTNHKSTCLPRRQSGFSIHHSRGPTGRSLLSKGKVRP